MSFILEALKKSEKSRQQASAPNLNTQHHSPPQPPHKKSMLAGLALTLLIINAVILIWLFGPWTQLNTPDDNNVTITELPQSQPTTLTAAATEPAPTSATSVKSVVITKPASNQAIETAVPTTNAVALTTEMPTPPLRVETFTPEARPILNIDELPPQLQQQAQQLHMSVHSYTGDNSSIIRLNNKIMSQGSTLDERYYLEQITADGAILNYQGYKFKILRSGY